MQNVKSKIIKKKVSLKNFTTFRIGGPAKYFFVAKTKSDIISGISWAKDKKLPFFILGRGSNLLVADRGFDGLVIKIKNQKFKITSTNQNLKIIECEAGMLLNQVVGLAIKNNLAGLEWAIGIPGTVGGAIYGNAGAFKRSMKEVVKEVEIFDVKTGKIKKLKNKDCKFNYRDSIFKKKKNLIILSAKLQLKKGSKNQIQKRLRKYLNYRKKTQPLNSFSAGSIFKNPNGKSAAELIDKAGLKGKKIGKAQISKKHPNFIINLGGARADQVLKLINLIKTRVKEKFNIELKEEIQYLGF